MATVLLAPQAADFGQQILIAGFGGVAFPLNGVAFLLGGVAFIPRRIALHFGGQPRIPLPVPLSLGGIALGFRAQAGYPLGFQGRLQLLRSAGRYSPDRGS